MASAEFVSGRVLAALTGQPACGPVTGTRSCGNGSQFKRVSGKFHGQNASASAVSIEGAKHCQGHKLKHEKRVRQRR